MVRRCGGRVVTALTIKRRGEHVDFSSLCSQGLQLMGLSSQTCPVVGLLGDRSS